MGYVQCKDTSLSIPLGNTKLGAIPSFSTLAHVTCPGASDWCRQVCYAQKLIVRFPDVDSAIKAIREQFQPIGLKDAKEIYEAVEAAQL